jgi:hypothetical protein
MNMNISTIEIVIVRTFFESIVSHRTVSLITMDWSTFRKPRRGVFEAEAMR